MFLNPNKNVINDSKGKCCICEINQIQHFVHGSVSEIYFFLFGAHNARGKKVCSNRFSVSYVLAGWGNQAVVLVKL